MHKPLALAPSTPIAKRGIHERESGNRRRIGAQDARAQARCARRMRRDVSELTLGLIEAALGSDQQRQGTGIERAKRGKRIGGRRCPRHRKSAAAAASQCGERRLERFGVEHLRDAQDAALLGGLDGIGTHASPLTRSGVVRRVRTGRKRATPISVAFCTM